MLGMCGMTLVCEVCGTHGGGSSPAAPTYRCSPILQIRFLAPGTALLQQQISGFLRHSICYFFNITPNISLASVFQFSVFRIERKGFDFRVLMSPCCRCKCKGCPPPRTSPRWRPCRGCTWVATPCPSASTTRTRL